MSNYTFDKDRYLSLVNRAVFDCSMYRSGSYQDRSRYSRAITMTGAPRPLLLGSNPAYSMSGAASFDTAVIPGVVRMDAKFGFEFVQQNHAVGVLSYPFTQRNNIAGNFSGFIVYFSNVATLNVSVYNGVGAATRSWGVTLPVRPNHVVFTCDPTIAAGAASCWCNNAAMVVVPAGAGPGLTLQTDTALQVGGTNVGDLVTGCLYRIWQEDLVQADADALYGAMSTLLVGEV